MKPFSLLAAGAIAAMLLGGVGTAHAQTVLQNFTGNFYGGGDGTTTPAAPTYNGYTPTSYNGFIPPDTMGAAGVNNFIQLINGGYSIYSKTGTLLNPTGTTDSNFWTAAGISASVASSISDPHILFDPSSQRWFASEITVPFNPTTGATLRNQFLVAVSNSADPTQGFKGYAYNANTGTGTGTNFFADYDMLGINAAGVYVGANLFNNATGASSSGDILSVSKAGLLAGGAANPASTLTYKESYNTYGFGARPVVDQDNGGTAANLSEPVLGVSNTTFGPAVLSTIGGTAAAATLTNNATVVFTASSNGAGTANQKGGNNTIDTGDDRYSGYVVKQNGVIYAAHTLADPTTGLADIAIQGTNTAGQIVVDQLLTGTGKGTGGTNLDLYYPSLAINGAGQLVIGYSGSGTADFASAYAITGQLAPDGKSILFGSQIQTAVGQGNYFVTFGAATDPNRFGDYSSTTLDPTDPTKFWTVQEFAIGTNLWGTQITQIGFLAAAPEPSQYAAFGIGILGLGILVARRRKASAA